MSPEDKKVLDEEANAMAVIACFVIVLICLPAAGYAFDLGNIGIACGIAGAAVVSAIVGLLRYLEPAESKS